MKTTIVTGLLGSGKTTFIKNLVRHAGERTVVLVNDFGAAGIDGEIFSAYGIESVELPSGCVCCTLKFDLIATVRKIVQEFGPEHLVIEPSGVSSPTGVLESLESAGVFGYSVVGVVDVTEFSELYESGMYGSFFRDQVALSDLLLVNKIDRADERTILKTEMLIESINPRAVVIRTKNAQLGDGLALPIPDKERHVAECLARGAGVRAAVSSDMLFKSGTHFHFETLSFKLDGQTTLLEFSGFFGELVQGRYGAVARAKALLNAAEGPYRFDGVYGKMDKVRFEKDFEEGRLVIIGERLDKLGIEKALAG